MATPDQPAADFEALFGTDSVHIAMSCESYLSSHTTWANLRATVFVLVVVLFNLYMFRTLRHIQKAYAFKKHIHKAFFS